MSWADTRTMPTAANWADADAVELLLSLRQGVPFRLRGRCYTVARYSGWTHYSDGRCRLPVFPYTEYGADAPLDRGERFVTVRPSNRVELLGA